MLVGSCTHLSFLEISFLSFHSLFLYFYSFSLSSLFLSLSSWLSILLVVCIHLLHLLLSLLSRYCSVFSSLMIFPSFRIFSISLALIIRSFNRYFLMFWYVMRLVSIWEWKLADFWKSKWVFVFFFFFFSLFAKNHSIKLINAW